MDVFEELKKKYDIEEDEKLERLIVNNSIEIKDFILLKNIAKYKSIKEIKVERRASVYENTKIAS